MRHRIKDYTPPQIIMDTFRQKIKENNSNIKEFCGMNDINYSTFRSMCSDKRKMNWDIASKIYRYIGEIPPKNKKHGDYKSDDIDTNAILKTIGIKHNDVYKSMMDKNNAIFITEFENAMEALNCINMLERNAGSIITNILAIKIHERNFVILTVNNKDKSNIKSIYDKIACGELE